MTRLSDERAAEMRDLFFETAQELLQALNHDALALEKGTADAETVRALRRTVHTLKGDAAACGFRELSELAHELEDALASKSSSSPATLAEVAFTAADTFGTMLAAYRDQSTLPSAQPLRKMIRQMASGGKEKTRTRTRKTVAPSRAQWSEYEKLAVQHARDAGQSVYHVTIILDSSCAMPIAARQLLLNATASASEVLASRPEPGAQNATGTLELLLASRHSAAQIAAQCRIPTISKEVTVEELARGNSRPSAAIDPARELDEMPALPTATSEPPVHNSPAAEETSGTRSAASAGAVENTLRVEAARIDTVLNLVGELIIGKSMLQQAVNEFSRQHPKDSLRGRLADALAFQSRVLSDLQRSVMKVRMVPVEQLFRRFPRVIRDVAKQCGKEVDLELSGQATDLDKSLLDAIAEPLSHLVRNAVSHGIEDAAERTRLGKPARGTIRLDAYHQGNQVVVEIRDDGRGIDSAKIKATAIAQGLLRPEDATRLTEGEILEFIFRPGFSTAQEITEISGRGVGLDVVQSVLHRLKGVVETSSQPGRGTTFRLKLPLTLAILKALLFRVEQRVYAIPLNAVAEIARAHQSDLHRVENYEVVQLRGQVLELVRLGRPPQIDAAGHSKLFILVIAVGDRRLGLIVDSLEGEEELVIKALDDHAADTELVSGASILGNGRVVLILNLSAVVERSAKARLGNAEQVPYGLLLSHSDRARLARGAAGGQL